MLNPTGRFLIKTPFSKEDFRIKWLQISAIYSQERFLTSTRGSGRIYGRISSPKIGRLEISTDTGDKFTFPVEEITYIKLVEKGFLDRINASIDMGFTLTRSRNQRQFTVRSRFGYITEKWSFDASFNKLSSSQNETKDISRGDGNLTSFYVMPKEWLILARIDFLYNTEQLIDLRTNMKLGLGKYLLRTNHMTWTVLSGVSFNIENFEGEITDRRSGEAWVGSELNIFDTGDLSLFSNIFVYPSTTEKNRLRVDYTVDLKYDLPLDFYIKTGLSLNYDNQPAGNSNKTDYIIQTTFVWSW